MRTNEIIKNSLTVPVKEVADELSLSKEQVYKWLDGSQRNPLDRIECLLRASTGNNDIINHLANKSGGYFIETPNSDESSSEVCAKACKEFGELLTAMSSALVDGVVDKEEYIRINKEWSDLQNVMHGFLSEKFKELELELKYQ